MTTTKGPTDPTRFARLRAAASAAARGEIAQVSDYAARARAAFELRGWNFTDGGGVLWVNAWTNGTRSERVAKYLSRKRLEASVEATETRAE